VNISQTIVKITHSKQSSKTLQIQKMDINMLKLLSTDIVQTQ